MNDSTPHNPATLSMTFASLIPQGVAAAELRAPGDASLLWPAEALFIANAVPKRVQEFAAGRLCARRALAEFGVTDFAVQVAGDRRPVWPESLIGSITHTAGFCAAVVAERARLLALGIDTEVAGAVKAELWSSICVAEELAWLESLQPGARAAAATLIFAVKEAVYKCQYPLTFERLSFRDLCVSPVDWGAAHGVYAVAPTRPLAIFNRAALSVSGRPASVSASFDPRPCMRGSYRFHEEFVSASAFLPATY